MPSQHKTPLPGWHPPAGLAAWVRAEAGRRGVPLSVVLNEAVERLRFERLDADHEQGEQGEADEPVQHGRNRS